MFLRIFSVFILSFSIFSTGLLKLEGFHTHMGVYAQEEEVVTTEEEETEPQVTLLSVMINNESAEVLDGEIVSVKADDAVRLAGSAKPGSEVFIYFGEKKITTTVKENGYWFILFSITDMQEGQYAVRAGYGELEKAEIILTLVLGDADLLIDPLEDSRNIIKIVTETQTSYIVPIILVPLAFALGWILGVFLKKRGKGSEKKSKKKTNK